MEKKPTLAVDHTASLERRLKAVQISAGDSCSFFLQREGSFIYLRRCRYCEYADFQSKFIDEDSKGMCKFRP